MDDPKSRPVSPADDRKQDEAVEETFPASDPPAIGGSTGPGDVKRSP